MHPTAQPEGSSIGCTIMYYACATAVAHTVPLVMISLDLSSISSRALWILTRQVAPNAMDSLVDAVMVVPPTTNSPKKPFLLGRHLVQTPTSDAVMVFGACLTSNSPNNDLKSIL